MLSAMRESLTRLANRYGIGFFVYCGVSVVSALCEWSVFMACLRVAGPVVASVIGFVCATGVNFVLSHFLAFRSKRPLAEELFLVATMSTVAFAANFATFYLLFTLAGLDVLYAKIIGTCAGFVFNYTLRQFYIFSRISRFPAISRLIDRGARIDDDIVALHADAKDSGEARGPSGRSAGRRA
jgi:putative flippase GtrA